jgi:hypothetical protein
MISISYVSDSGTLAARAVVKAVITYKRLVNGLF